VLIILMNKNIIILMTVETRFAFFFTAIQDQRHRTLLKSQ